ncbi:MAG: hypothetical protein LPK49_03610, partial [Bacteroidota bacterium]|nr:hypothetical protein [Bacteroidota bacterium]MDX5430105.1 hypothetical protein [Bacteroidota bacterium]
MKRLFPIFMALLMFAGILAPAQAQTTQDSLVLKLQGILDAKLPVYGIEGASLSLVFQDNR